MFKTKNFAIVLFVVFLLVVGVILFIKFKQKQVDLSDGKNNLPVTTSNYDQQLDHEVPTSTILYYQKDVLQIFSPLAGQTISSPLTIKGLAPNSWFFEGSFPVKLIASNGKELFVTVAQAQTDWMKPGLIPFTTKLDFVMPAGVEQGVLVFKADNPSGLPENDKSVEMTVKFFNDKEVRLEL